MADHMIAVPAIYIEEDLLHYNGHDQAITEIAQHYKDLNRVSTVKLVRYLGDNPDLPEYFTDVFLTSRLHLHVAHWDDDIFAIEIIDALLPGGRVIGLPEYPHHEDLEIVGGVRSILYNSQEFHNELERLVAYPVDQLQEEVIIQVGI